MLFNTAVVLSVALVALRFAIVAGLCFAFWRWLQLKALPWVGVWYIGGVVADLVAGYFIRNCSLANWKAGSHTPPPPGLAVLSTVMKLSAEIAALLAVLLVFSEAAFIMRRLYPEYRPVVLRFLTSTYQHVVAVGLVCVLLGIGGPLFALAYCYVRGLR